MTWWELLWYFCDYIEERDLRMRGKYNVSEAYLSR
tara:strand:+ start:133 stop:237 length:105 start_codon:yes stop_codon:yes gene_type:complete